MPLGRYRPAEAWARGDDPAFAENQRARRSPRLKHPEGIRAERTMPLRGGNERLTTTYPVLVPEALRRFSVGSQPGEPARSQPSRVVRQPGCAHPFGALPEQLDGEQDHDRD